VVQTVLVEEGARVEPGAVLARLDNSLAEQDLALARSELAHAKARGAALRLELTARERERNRLEPLADDDTIPAQELDLARDHEAQARAALQEQEAAVQVAWQKMRVAEQRASEGEVRAPAAGVIIRRHARPGNGVSVLNVTPLFVFAPQAPMIVRAELEERFLPEVRAGQRARVILEADDLRQFKAEVIRVGRLVGGRTPSDDPGERQDNRVVECVLLLEERTDLLIGQRVLVRFVGTSRSDAAVKG
jgi:HlyD family secretion protein